MYILPFNLYITTEESQGARLRQHCSSHQLYNILHDAYETIGHLPEYHEIHGCRCNIIPRGSHEAI
jgi:hypothetical protein